MAFLRIYLGKALKQQYKLAADSTRIGRASDNDIMLSSPGVSKHHAVVEKRGNKFVLRDHKSANGVFVNGKRVAKHSLKYRDEIQIFENTLVFMPLAKLPGETEAATGSQGVQRPLDAKVTPGKSTISDFIRTRKQKKIAQVVLSNALGREEKHVLDKAKFTIGRARNSDIRTSGWFAPRVAATIQKRSEGHYLIPAKRGRVQVNSMPVTEVLKLKDEDSILVRGLSFRFYFRPGHMESD